MGRYPTEKETKDVNRQFIKGKPTQPKNKRSSSSLVVREKNTMYQKCYLFDIFYTDKTKILVTGVDVETRVI